MEKKKKKTPRKNPRKKKYNKPLITLLSWSCAEVFSSWVGMTSPYFFGCAEHLQYQNTSQPGIYAVGDVTGHYELTPVAINAGRRLAARLFRGESENYLEYENIPTVWSPSMCECVDCLWFCLLPCIELVLFCSCLHAHNITHPHISKILT